MSCASRTPALALSLALSLSMPGYADETWTSLGLTDPGLDCVAVAPGDSALIAAGGSYLHVSADGGGTWTTHTAAPTVWSVAFGSNRNVAFAGCWGSGVFKSADGCTTWSQKNAGLANGVVKSVCVSPANDLLVYAAAEDGLYKSVDGGETWAPIKSGVNASAVVVSGLQPLTIYLGTWGSGVWKSLDGGGTWTSIGSAVLPAGGECNGLALDPADDSIVYAVFQGGGVWVSFDAGGGWTYVSPGFEGFAVAADPQRPGFVYGLGGWTTPKRSGCYGGGNGWTDMSAGWDPSWFARSIAVDPNDRTSVYACAGDGGLARWTADITPPDPAGALSASPSGNAVLLSWEPSGSSDCSGYWVYRRAGDEPYGLRPAFVVGGRETTTFCDVNVEAGTTYHYRIAAIDAAQNRSALSDEAGSEVAVSYDLDVAWIERLPRDCYFYWVDYPDGIPTLRPGSEGDKRWPAFGETVTFEAHVVNKGTAASPPANCRWKVNGVVIATGTVGSIEPGHQGTASVDWSWNVAGIDADHSDQTVTFEVDYDDQIAESFEQNNALTDYLEGASFVIYVERPIYDAFNTRVNLAGTRSFEDWIQAQFRSMNDNFARSTYAIAPNGCLERVRIDRIVVGPVPSERDGTFDGQWQFTGDPAYADWAADRVDGGLIHELMHQLGIIDLYMMPVLPADNGVTTPDGLPCGMGFGFARMGIMAGGDIAPHSSGASQTMPEYCSSHDVMGLNRNCGYRRGYYGEYMFDIPENNYIVVKDSAGSPVDGATIKVYQGGGGTMAGTPVATGTTDATGTFLLPNRPPVRTITTATGHTESASPFGTVDVVGANATLLVEMTRPGGDFDYRFLNLIQFNLAYWGGHTDEWTCVIDSRLAANSLARITTLNAAVESSGVKLVWPAVAGASAYRVCRASWCYNQPDDPDHLYENWVMKPIATTTETSYDDTSRYETSRYAVAPVAPDDTEGPLSNRVFAPNLVNPWAVGILPDNQRVILDPQNGYAFLRQTADGVFVANTGSVHNHVELSHFLAVDRRLNRLLISHPTDDYGGPHSIRVTDYEGSLDGLRDIGTQGSEPGQFDNPGGVAVDDASRIYAVDTGNNRLQILDADGSFIAAYGTAGSDAGQFSEPQGIAVTADRTIYVCDRGNNRVEILRFRPEETAVDYVGTLGGKELLSPTGVAVARNGHVFVTDADANTVEEYDASNVWVRSFTTARPPYAGPLSGPTGIAMDDRGQVIVCDTNNRRVVTVAVILDHPGDFDFDGDVDLADFGHFQRCFNGPNRPAATSGCDDADLDVDSDVDLADFSVFRSCFNGPNRPPACP